MPGLAGESAQQPGNVVVVKRLSAGRRRSMARSRGSQGTLGQPIGRIRGETESMTRLRSWVMSVRSSVWSACST